MQKPKLVFSDAELQLVLNTEFILTKNRIIQKVYEQFGIIASLLSEELKPLQRTLPVAFKRIPKISKGENYGGLPWVMLDYPRHFDDVQGHFAFRCFFCWAQGYVLQWQVSGPYMQPFLHMLSVGNIPVTVNGLDVYCGFPEDPYLFSCKQQGMDIVSEKRVPDIVSPDKRIMKIMTEIPMEDFEKLDNVITTMSGWAVQAFAGINFQGGETTL